MSISAEEVEAVSFAATAAAADFGSSSTRLEDLSAIGTCRVYITGAVFFSTLREIKL